MVPRRITRISGRIIGTSAWVLASALLTGCSMMHNAASKGHLDGVKLQLALGASPNSRWDWYLETPLHKAAANGHIEVAELLLEKGADVNQSDEAWGRPLHGAALNGHVEMVKLLLENGADVEGNCAHSPTPLVWAAQTGQIEVAEILLASGADVNSGEGRALRRAVWYGQPEMLRFLFARGADMDARPRRGAELLQMAARRDGVDLARTLLEHGANLDKSERKIPRMSDEFRDLLMEYGVSREG